MEKQEHFASLDCLRGLASLQVVLFHVPPWYPPLYNARFIRNGGLMVNFFFVLSGFVLFHSYADRIKDRADFAKFIALRLGRIYPVHLVFLLLFAATEGLKYFAAQHGVAGGASGPFSENTSGAFVESLFLVHALGFSKHASAFNFPSWSISTEFYTYLIFALSVVMARKRLVALSATLFTGSLLLLLLARPELGAFQEWVRCIAGFFLGCTTCAVQRALIGVRLSPTWPALAFTALFVFLNLDQSGATAELIFPLSSLVVLALALSSGGLINASLMLFRWLGVLSYSLYMCHALVLWVIRQACRVLLKSPEVVVDGVTTAQVGTPLALALVFASVVGSLMLAWLTYQFIENPGRLWTRAWVSGREANSVRGLKRVSQ